ncbi:MAG: hypothetical protein ACOH19_05345, partial [Rhodoglobus sp.]
RSEPDPETTPQSSMLSSALWRAYRNLTTVDTGLSHRETEDVHTNGPSWRMSETSTRSVLFALYAREALGIRKLNVPALYPGIARAEASTPHDELDTQWGRWWASVVEPELAPARGSLGLLPGTSHTVALPLAGAEVLYDALAAIAEDAEEWTRAADDSLRELAMTRAHGMEVTHLVKGFDEKFGRPVHPFRLDVELVPTTERGIWWIGQHTIAVSAELRSDPDAYVAALRPIVAMLA